MLNKLIFFVFVTLGLAVIVLCIIKSTKIQEHYKTSNLEYSDVILPCEKKEMKKSYSIKRVFQIIKKYDIDKADLKIIKNKLVEKGIKNKICHRALVILLDTYLIYYKPIIDSILLDLKKIKPKMHQEEEEYQQEDAIDDDEELDQDQEQEQEMDDNNQEMDDNNQEMNNNNNQEMDDEELKMDDEDQENVNCKSLNNLVSVLESDGFITKLNRRAIQKHYQGKCLN